MTRTKAYLFLTFLVQFWIVFLLTVLGLVQAIPIDKAYLDKLFYLLILESAGSVIALFKKTKFFDEADARQTKPEESRGVTAPPPEKPKAGIPTDLPGIFPEGELPPEPLRLLFAETYFHSFHALAERFKERELFAKNANGQRVRWKGSVRSASSRDSSVSVQLSPIVSSYGDCFFVSLPKALETRALALHKGDCIEASGELSTENMPEAPTIEAEDFAFVAKDARTSA